MHRRYKDDNGKVMSEEEFKKLFSKFERDYKNKYETIVETIIQTINERCSTDSQKLKMLFEYLTSKDMKYDYDFTIEKDGYINHPGYTFPPYG